MAVNLPSIWMMVMIILLDLASTVNMSNVNVVNAKSVKHIELKPRSQENTVTNSVLIMTVYFLSVRSCCISGVFPRQSTSVYEPLSWNCFHTKGL